MIQAQNVKLNLVPGGIIPVLHASQYDENRVLTFTLYDGMSPAEIPSGTLVTIEGTKSDNHGFSYTATLTDNVVTVNTTLQMTIFAEVIECKLKLAYNGVIIGTAMFLLDVEKAGVTDGTIISDTEVPAIIALASQQEENAEAWANGTRGGVPTQPTDPTYHKDSHYWAEYAESAVTGVTGVKGNAESEYRRGNVNITLEDLGMDTEPTEGSTNAVTSNGIYEAIQPISSSILSIGGRVSDVENEIGNTDISSVGATVTGAISNLNSANSWKRHLFNSTIATTTSMDFNLPSSYNELYLFFSAASQNDANDQPGSAGLYIPYAQLTTSGGFWTSIGSWNNNNGFFAKFRVQISGSTLTIYINNFSWDSSSGSPHMSIYYR